MDLGTLLGYLLARGALAYGAHHASHGALSAYIKPGEILLVGGCALGATMTVTVPGSILWLGVPCSASLVGSTLAVQGAAFAAGGCPAFGQLVTSNTIDVTIR